MVAEAASLPSDDGLGLDDDEGALPPRPPSREGDPEGSIDGGESWPPLLVGVDCELLAEGELYDRLLLSAPEEGREAAERGGDKGSQGTHRAGILAGAKVPGKAESGAPAGLSSRDASVRETLRKPAYEFREEAGPIVYRRGESGPGVAQPQDDFRTSDHSASSPLLRTQSSSAGRSISSEETASMERMSRRCLGEPPSR